MSSPSDIVSSLGAKTIAMLGASEKPDRDSNRIFSYLLSQGYQVIPINPTASEVANQKAYKSLLEIPKNIKIDMVNVFRKKEALTEVFEEISQINVKFVWLQLGLEHDVGMNVMQCVWNIGRSRKM